MTGRSQVDDGVRKYTGAEPIGQMQCQQYRWPEKGLEVNEMEKTPQELHQERLKRVEDAVQLKVPDRVPIVPLLQFFPVKYAGITFEEAFYDHQKWLTANKKTVIDFEPDMYQSPQFGVATSGAILEALDLKQIKWPGHGVSPNRSFQFIEDEYMKADEYDAFLEDPSDYAVRTYMPRIYGALEAFRRLPPLKIFLHGYGGSGILAAAAAMPEVVSALESLLKAGREALKQASASRSFHKEMTELGFPAFVGAASLAPFDLFSDMLRGMRGSMLDMYRQPDKLLEAMEKVFPTLIWMGVSGAKRTGNPRVFIPLHRGADGFMSLKQFEAYYWPSLKKLLLALIDEGLTPCPFFEGSWTSRLEYLNELPKGKILARFDATDIFKAKEIIGGCICIQGNVPLSLLQTGTAGEVKDYCKKLIDVVGKDGGFVMDAGGGMDDAKPELVRAMFDFTKEYGVYR